MASPGDSDVRRIAFPRIERIALANFDLYTRKPNVDTSVDRNVFALIGANGLGKSTFLNTLNFGVTGAIPEPTRKFQSETEYFQDAARPERTRDYFSGRVSEALRPLAQVTVRLAWSTKTITVTRDIFNASRIAVLTVTDSAGVVDPNVPGEASDLDAVFQREVSGLTGLADFAQFVFLFHFVATFDEGRHLLMWDSAALSNALYLAFGADPAAAKAADRLRHDMERESSRARNAKFAARNVTLRIEQLSEVLDKTKTDEHVNQDDLRHRYDSLNERQERAEERLRIKQAEQRDADVRWTDFSAALTNAQIEYRRLFSSRVRKSVSVEHHPVIRATLSEDKCAICGAAHAAAIIKADIAGKHCPLCDSPLDASPADAEVIDKLRSLDAEQIDLQEKLRTVIDARERIASETLSAVADVTAARESVREFEEKEAGALAGSDTASFSVLKTQIQDLERERNGFTQQSVGHYAKRDELRDSLRVHEKTLKEQYERGSERFVPTFRELAQEFIGIPVDVALEHFQGTNATGFGLQLQLDGKLRSRADEVSESQRFFIDIALRMALAEFMSDGPATLLIDTPEGSLDIAYEARAGAMFSSFVAHGNVIIMTANIRSSLLVERLAQLQGKKGMQLVKMTDWTELSRVQEAEEDLFIRAYREIEGALN
jgi:ABC-type lipoprotein export system ATPase subunit